MLIEVKDSVGIAPLVGVVAVPVESDGRAPSRIENVKCGVCAAVPMVQLRRGIGVGGEAVAEDALDAGAAHADVNMVEQYLPVRLRLDGGRRRTPRVDDGIGCGDKQGG